MAGAGSRPLREGAYSGGSAMATNGPRFSDDDDAPDTTAGQTPDEPTDQPASSTGGSRSARPARTARAGRSPKSSSSSGSRSSSSGARATSSGRGRSRRRPSGAGGGTAPAPVRLATDGAGVLLGFLLWVWVALPLISGGPSEVRAVWSAKLTNRTPDGQVLA